MTKRRQFTGRLIVAGPTRTMTGEVGGYVVPAGAIRRAIDEGLFRGLACFVDHAEGTSSVRRLLGVWRDVGWAGDDRGGGAAVGRLVAYETAETAPVLALLEQWLEEGRGEGEKGSGGERVPASRLSTPTPQHPFTPSTETSGKWQVAGQETRPLTPAPFPPFTPSPEASGKWQVAGEEARSGTPAPLPPFSPAQDRPDLGISIVFYPQLAADGRTVERIVMVESADVVMFPASVGSVFVGAGAGGKLQVASRWGEGEKGRKGERARAGSASHSQPSIPDDSVHQQFVNGSRFAVKENSGEGEDVNEQFSCTRSPFLPFSLSNQKTASPDKLFAVNQIKQEQKEMNDVKSSEKLAQGALMQGAAAAELPKVALAQGALARGGGAATAERPQANGAAETVTDPALSGWLEALQTAAASAVIRASGLPAAVQDRLASARYETAEQVYEAVDRARAELGALAEAGVVQLGGRPGGAGRPSARLGDPLDEARGLVGFFFGAADAPTPPPNLRSFADLYVALTGDVHFRGVFDGGRVAFSGATTSTLPNLAVDAMNRVIVQQFQALDHYRWYERITDVAPNDGRLHDMKWITLGGIGNLPTVVEGAVYTELSVADVQETAAFVKRGGYVGITREMIKNGDLMQLQAIPRALASAAVRTRSAAVSALFTAGSGVGPTLTQDSKALFHADHANLATTALGADATAWRAARAECFQQPEVGSAKPLGIFPRFLLVPAELYDTALSILGYGEGMPTSYAPEAQGRGFADPRPVPLVVPDWTDATDWAYVVDPAVFPVIQMSYSQSPGGRRHPTPELFAVVSETSGLMFSNDVLPIKVRDEFAVGVNGPRGIGKRNVA